MNSFTILAYDYRAARFCPDCIISHLMQNPDYEGWSLGEGLQMSTEQNLTEIAWAFGIDRQDEDTFDSNDFPKVVFADHLNDIQYDEECDDCGEVIAVAA